MDNRDITIQDINIESTLYRVDLKLLLMLDVLMQEHHVSCVQYVLNTFFAAAVAVALLSERCTICYALMPVLVGAATIVLIAVIFNYAFPWRRYPLSRVDY